MKLKPILALFVALLFAVPAFGMGVPLSQYSNGVAHVDYFGGATLPADIVVTRSTASATYYNSSGILATAGANVPRFDYDPTTLTLKGLLQEEQRTNLNTNSTVGSAWTPVAGSGSSVTVTANFATAPDGTTTATRLQITNVGNFALAAKTNLTITAGTYVQSLWMKLNTGTSASVGFGDGNGSNTGGTTTSVTVTNQWQRFSIVQNYTGTGSTIEVLGGTGSIDVLVYGPQTEAGATATTYIPTVSSTVTRNADLIGPASIPWMNSSAGTLQAAWNESAAAPSSTIYYPVNLNASSGNFFAIESNGFVSGNIYYQVYKNNSPSAQFSSGVLPGSSNNAAASYGASAYALSVNGGTASTSAAGNLPVFDGTQSLSLGGSPVRGVRWYKIFDYWNYQVDNSKLKVVSR